MTNALPFANTGGFYAEQENVINITVKYIKYVNKWKYPERSIFLKLRDTTTYLKW